MPCTCGGRTRVLETRTTVRRRECLECGDKFWTEEVKLDYSYRPPAASFAKRKQTNWNNPFGI